MSRLGLDSGRLEEIVFIFVVVIENVALRFLRFFGGDAFKGVGTTETDALGAVTARRYLLKEKKKTFVDESLVHYYDSDP